MVDKRKENEFIIAAGEGKREEQIMGGGFIIASRRVEVILY